MILISQLSIGINGNGLAASCDIILDLLFSLNLKQTVHAYTRETSVLELFFVSQTFFDGVLSVEAGISDHRLLFFCCVSPVVCRMHPVKMIKDCTCADDNAIIDSLQSQLDNPCRDDLHSL